MPYYRLHQIEQDGFAGVDDFEAEDDVQAVRRAETPGGSSGAELPSGKRKIRLFTPRNAAARVPDRKEARMVKVIGFKGWDQTMGKMVVSRLKATAGALDRNRSAQPVMGTEEDVPETAIDGHGFYDPAA